MEIQYGATVWCTLATVRQPGSHSVGGPSLVSAIERGTESALHMAGVDPARRVFVTIDASCATCSGTHRVPVKRKRTFATKACPACRGKDPEGGFTFELKHRCYAIKILRPDGSVLEL
jgi:hypothetical protein